MKHAFFIGIFAFLISCGSPEKTKTEDLKAELIATDRAFSAMSEQRGMTEAFLFYAADDVIKPEPNHQPIVGKEALRKSYENSPPRNFVLTWEPLKADVSDDLGYTFGNWTLKPMPGDTVGSIHYGNYVSIWKRQADGSWKFVLDTGNSTPGPSQLN